MESETDLQEARREAREWSRRRVERGRKKRRARYYVYRAIREGELERPDECSRCGEEPEQLEAHHHDYDRPLDVEFLCRACHRDEHE